MNIVLTFVSRVEFGLYHLSNDTQFKLGVRIHQYEFHENDFSYKIHSFRENARTVRDRKI